MAKKTPGRPRHIPSDFGRHLVVVLAGQAIPQSEIARVLDVDGKTLRRHYRRELNVGAAKLEAALIGHVLRLAAGDDDVALRAIIFLLRCRFGWSRYLPPPWPPEASSRYHRVDS
ncbi:RNA polymerase subunit sigma-70 [Rhizobium phaseoli]|uniref:RNA polymerase subunit sigma-70 n=1 Tax=Rhizobium phaseoli TaxID=396 RepID=UPI003138ED13